VPGLGLGVQVVAFLLGQERQLERLGVNVQCPGILVEPVEVEAAVGHAGHGAAVRMGKDQIAPRVGRGVERAGHLDRRSVEQLPGLPLFVADAECHGRALQADHVRPEPLHHRPLHLGQHLVEVVHPRRRVDAQTLLELVVSGGGNARLARAAQVDRHAVRLAVVQG